MTREEALAFLQRVQHEAPGIQATFDESYARGDEHGYRVHLRLAGRELSVNYAGQWESIKQAWQWFLPGLKQQEEKKPARRGPLPRPRCLVDGIVMSIFQKGIYWRGTWWHEGKQYYRSFGKADPRKSYPLVTKPEAEPEGIAR